jgi:UDPglucose 6-dehydrogenase
VTDFLHPDRIVLGATRRADAERVATLYRPLTCPILVTDPRTAEMIKYASNAYLATKISFINEVAAICERLGADVRVVAEGMGRDARIGRAFLDAGLGWGGSCFPKDVKALAHMAAVSGCHPQLLRTVIEINKDQRRKVIHTLRDALGTLEGQTVALLGLAFKPNTDDLREAPALELAHLLHADGASLRAYDPVAMPAAQRLLPGVTYAHDAYDAVTGADATVVVTEWNEFKQLDLPRLRQAMARPVLVDGRNLYEPAAARAAGFLYFPIGRGNADGEK